MTAPTLDHVGVVTRELSALADSYERLGFTLTPLARQADGRIGNRCVMLHRSYIELLAVVDPQASSATLERFLARYAGVHILAFGINDVPATLARLSRAGVEASATQAERPIDDADPDGPRARFEWVHVPDQPEGRINLVRHLSPQALWQPRFLNHPNKAAVLSEVSILVAEPADTAARFSRLVGCVVVPDPAGGFALDLAFGRVRVLQADGPVVPRIADLTLGTSDENATMIRLVKQHAIAHELGRGALVIDPRAAGGVALRFVGAI